jgi:hypothetical protein
MPALEGPVLFRTIAGFAPRDPLLSAAPKPKTGFLGAVGFARDGERNWIFLSGFTPRTPEVTEVKGRHADD